MPSPATFRKLVLDEYSEQCVNCDATEGIEVHHLDGDRNNNTVENGIPLCRHCHSKLHRTGLNGLENELLPVEERSHIPEGMTSYQFWIEEDEWTEWKNTVPRVKSLDERIRELIRADTKGQVTDIDIQELRDTLERALDELPESHPARTSVEDAVNYLKKS